MLANARAELPGLQKAGHKTAPKAEQIYWLLFLQKLLMRTWNDFNIVSSNYQAIPKMRVRKLSLDIEFSIYYSFQPQLALSPNIHHNMALWRTANHAISSFLSRSMPQKLSASHLQPSIPTHYWSPSASRDCLHSFMPMPTLYTSIFHKECVLQIL